MDARYHTFDEMNVFNSTTFCCRVRDRILCIQMICAILDTRLSQFNFTICLTELVKITPKTLTVSAVCRPGIVSGSPLMNPTSIAIVFCMFNFAPATS